ncbi:unnamed protein product [Ixodes pacificus]
MLWHVNPQNLILWGNLTALHSPTLNKPQSTVGHVHSLEVLCETHKDGDALFGRYS